MELIVRGVSLTATTRNRPAHVPPPGEQDSACTSFTGELCDLIRAGLVLWGIWLITLFVVFSAATTIITYYTAALSPAVAGWSANGMRLGS